MAVVNGGLSENTELQQRLIATVHHELKTTETPGAAVTLLLDGQPLFVSGVGFRDLDRTIPLDAHAQFYIYSVTKSLLATVILQFVEQGRIALDTPIQAYLPQLPLDTPVTVRQLLNHTGGIPDYYALPAYVEALKTHPTHPWTFDEFLTHTLPHGLTFAPGHGWGYSNIGFLLIRRLIETMLNTSLHAALHEHLFGPLDLQQTFVPQTLDDARHLTPGYSTFFQSDNALHDVRPVYHPGWVSHGVVITRALELARMIDALFIGQLINQHSLAAMLEPVVVSHTHDFFQQPAYGLGLMLDSQSRYGIIAGHGGEGPGYSAAALQVPNIHGRRITSIVLANRDQHDLGLRTAFTLAMLLGDTLTPEGADHMPSVAV